MVPFSVKPFHFFTSTSISANKYAFEDIVDALVDGNKRAKWDKDIKEIKTQSNELGSMAIIYTIYQRFNIIGTAFTSDKQIMFSTEGEDDNKIFVVYTSSLPNDIIPEFQGLNFIKVLFCITVFEEQSDGSTTIQTFMQIDPERHLKIEDLKHEVILDSILMFHA
jgi:hypothetical protein